MLCPFNSRSITPFEQSNNRLSELSVPLIEEKESMIKFGFQVRDLDREYEMRNNQDFDTGVYHKYAYEREQNEEVKLEAEESKNSAQ